MKQLSRVCPFPSQRFDMVMNSVTCSCAKKVDENHGISGDKALASVELNKIFEIEKRQTQSA